MGAIAPILQLYTISLGPLYHKILLPPLLFIGGILSSVYVQTGPLLKFIYSETSLSGHLRDLTKCPLNRGLKKIAQCLLTILILTDSTVTPSVIEFRVVKEAKE